MEGLITDLAAAKGWVRMGKGVILGSKGRLTELNLFSGKLMERRNIEAEGFAQMSM